MHQACLNQLSSLAHPKFHTECGKGGESRPGSGKTQPHCPGEAGTGLCHCRTKVVVIPGGAQDKQGQAERSRAWSAEGDKAQRDPFVTMTQREQREAGAKLILEVHRSRKRDEGQSWDMEFHLHIKGGKNLHKSGQTLEEGPEDPQSVVSPSLCVLGRQTPAGAQSWGPARPEAKAPKWSSVTLPT